VVGEGKQFFFCKKRTKKTFALRRGGGEAGVSHREFAMAYTGLAAPASQGKSFLRAFLQKSALS
jgi:hypothetical protein